MFEDQSTINIQPTKSHEDNGALKKYLKIFLFSLCGLIILGGTGYWFVLSKLKVQPINEEPIVSSVPVEAITGQLSSSTFIVEAKPGDFLIEEVSFQNFYPLTASGFKANIDNYSLPINIKTDVINYPDVSRKINLDPAINSLNVNGFGVLENPDEKKLTDFYSSYSWLQEKGLPILLTSDFLTYYYQNSVKLSYKYLEENLFYNSLWQISKELFDTSRARYENRRSQIGKINDVVLEGERLELAFFAVSLQLLKPQEQQIIADNLVDPEKFSFTEAKAYDFILPEYLKDDVERELALIRASKETVKSPVLLYSRNYNEFILPPEYRENARLNNFYLAAKWLNSSFPLYFKGKDCPDCQLDENDWQVNLTASSFISHDFYQSYEVKNQWARVYKTLGFFKGLREDLTYLDYQKVLVDSFGEDYDLEQLLGTENKESNNNYNKLRSGLLLLNFPEWAGGFNRLDAKVRPQVGFRVLADFFSSNDFVAAELTSPKVGSYQGKESKLLSICEDGKGRCKLLSLDIINLLFSYPDPLWMKNIEYQGFSTNFLRLKQTISNFTSWQTNNYWANLKIIKDFLENPRSELPIFAQNDAWRKKEIDSAKAYWLNLQSSRDLVQVAPSSSSLGQENTVEAVEYYYVEPNLALADELIADSKMILGMYDALQINTEAPLAYSRIEALHEDLKYTQSLIKKELSSQTLSTEDSIFIGKLATNFKSSGNNYANFNVGQKSLNYKFLAPKMLAITFKVGNKKILSVGPIFSFSESSTNR